MANEFQSIRNVETGDGRVFEPFTDADAAMLRQYKKFLSKYGLKESLWCQMCAALEQPEGLRASVMDAAIDMECRCTVRRHRGSTF